VGATMQQQQKQQAYYEPLTNEQKASLNEIENLQEFPIWYVLIAILIFIFITLINSMWDMNFLLEWKYLRRWVALLLLSFLLLGIPLRKARIKQYIENGFLKSQPHQAPVTAGFLTYATFYTPIKKRSEYNKALIPLLNKMTSKEASRAFTKRQRKILRQIASESYWHTHEPDLVGAALVGLVALNDFDSKEILTKLSQKSWSEQEKWMGNAAKLCLEKWGTR
jgi:hypothetical protein